MKQGINFHLPVRVDVDLESVEKIEFAFSENNDNKILKSNSYPENVMLKSDGITLLIPFTQKETYLFQGDFLMDTRITLKGTTDQPQTPIIHLYMSETLFEKEAEPVGNS